MTDRAAKITKVGPTTVRLASIAAACDTEEQHPCAPTLRAVDPVLHQAHAVLRGDEVIGVVYRDEPTRGWFAADLDALTLLTRRINDGAPDAYTHWCSDTYADEHDYAEQAAASLAGAYVWPEVDAEAT